ncbi:hypothetical protein B0H15DRAFT_958637 [Mycena belliarum]|uniref:Uncharacterized protein n=1 Tax=Mycena belliarum TaxID=1033014 RepID=A0AAD6TPV7_9AGAR|nr:hypothetical protein B0H15DRAFT_958637 [Mycena belliae]
MPTLRHLVAQLANNLRPLGKHCADAGKRTPRHIRIRKLRPQRPRVCAGRTRRSRSRRRTLVHAPLYSGAANGHAPSKMDVDVAGGGDDGSLAAPRDSKAAAARDHRSSSSSSAPHASSAPSSSAAARRPSLRIEYLDVAGLDIWRVNLFCSSSVDARAHSSALTYLLPRTSASSASSAYGHAQAQRWGPLIGAARGVWEREVGLCVCEHERGLCVREREQRVRVRVHEQRSNGHPSASTSNPYTVVESAGGWKVSRAREAEEGEGGD